MDNVELLVKLSGYFYGANEKPADDGDLGMAITKVVHDYDRVRCEKEKLRAALAAAEARADKVAAELKALAALDRHDELQPINSTHATGTKYAGSLP